jgi:hypothetical protein
MTRPAPFQPHDRVRHRRHPDRGIGLVVSSHAPRPIYGVRWPDFSTTKESESALVKVEYIEYAPTLKKKKQAAPPREAKFVIAWSVTDAWMFTQWQTPSCTVFTTLAELKGAKFTLPQLRSLWSQISPLAPPFITTDQGVHRLWRLCNTPLGRSKAKRVLRIRKRAPGAGWKGHGIEAFTKEKLGQGHSVERTLELVREKFPHAKSTMLSVRCLRSRMKLRFTDTKPAP